MLDGRGEDDSLYEGLILERLCNRFCDTWCFMDGVLESVNY